LLAETRFGFLLALNSALSFVAVATAPRTTWLLLDELTLVVTDSR
jgi:hypothetical protein